MFNDSAFFERTLRGRFRELNKDATKLINAEVELDQRPRTCGHSRSMAPYRLSWGSEIPQTECIGTETQRNRRSDGNRAVEP